SRAACSGEGHDRGPALVREETLPAPRLERVREEKDLDGDDDQPDVRVVDRPAVHGKLPYNQPTDRQGEQHTERVEEMPGAHREWIGNPRGCLNPRRCI